MTNSKFKEIEEDEKSELLLKCIGLKSEKIPEFIDCYIYDGKIVVHADIGGIDRDVFKSTIKRLIKNRYFLYDKDDKQGGRWSAAKFYFSFPSQHEDILLRLEDTAKLSKAWQEFYSSIKDDLARKRKMKKINLKIEQETK